MTQNNSKIQGKFYPLTPDVAKKLRKAKLTAAEWRFWIYLVELDPYGDRYHDLDTLSIISELEISKATYYRAIAKFQKLGLFDFQDKGFSFKNETGVSKMRQESQKCETSLKNETASLKNETEFSKMRQPVSKMRKTEAETPTEQDFQNSSEYKTYSDFKDSLSEGEKENFLQFGKKKANELPHPPQLPLRWIEANFEELKSQWEKSQGKPSSVLGSKWENHPQREEWIEKIRKIGPVAFQAEDLPNEKLRQEFYFWADDNKLIWEPIKKS